MDEPTHHEECCEEVHIDVSALREVRDRVADQLTRLAERQKELADLMSRLGASDAVAQMQEELAAQQELLEREQEELAHVQVRLEGGASGRTTIKTIKLGDIGQKVTKIVTEVGDTLEDAFSSLKARTNVVMVRVDENTAEALDALVEAGVAKSRSQSAAFFLREGIKAQSGLFQRISEKIQAIQSLKEDLRAAVRGEFESDQGDAPD
jgi:hypothetical protein